MSKNRLKNCSSITDLGLFSTLAILKTGWHWSHKPPHFRDFHAFRCPYHIYNSRPGKITVQNRSYIQFTHSEFTLQEFQKYTSGISEFTFRNHLELQFRTSHIYTQSIHRIIYYTTLTTNYKSQCVSQKGTADIYLSLFLSSPALNKCSIN